jgi:hypothetical protein
MHAKMEVLEGSSSNGALSPEQTARLAANPAWQRSGFEALERFIFEFLTGGGSPAAASGGGSGEGGSRAGLESVRLKLEVCPYCLCLYARVLLAYVGFAPQV